MGHNTSTKRFVRKNDFSELKLIELAHDVEKKEKKDF